MALRRGDRAHPQRQRGVRAVAVLAELRARIVEADPHRAQHAAREADEPRIGVVVRRAGLAGSWPAERAARSGGRAALDDRAHHVLQLKRDALVEELAAVGADAIG